MSKPARSQHEIADAIEALVQERDQLRINYDRMTTELALQRQKTEQFESRLASASYERDHYMRYATDITAKLNNIQMLIGSTVEEAKHAAYKPTDVTKIVRQPLLSDADQKQLEQLVLKLPNGNTEGVD